MVTALCSMGPRQITASFSSTMNPMEITRTPSRSSGMIIWSMIVGFPWTPSMWGMLKP